MFLLLLTLFKIDFTSLDSGNLSRLLTIGIKLHLVYANQYYRCISFCTSDAFSSFEALKRPD